MSIKNEIMQLLNVASSKCRIYLNKNPIKSSKRYLVPTEKKIRDFTYNAPRVEKTLTPWDTERGSTVQFLNLDTIHRCIM